MVITKVGGLEHQVCPHILSTITQDSSKPNDLIANILCSALFDVLRPNTQGSLKRCPKEPHELVLHTV